MRQGRIVRSASIAALMLSGLNVRGEDPNQCEMCMRGEGCQVQYAVDLSRCDAEKSGSAMMKRLACQQGADDRFQRCSAAAERKCARDGKC